MRGVLKCCQKNLNLQFKLTESVELRVKVGKLKGCLVLEGLIIIWLVLGCPVESNRMFFIFHDCRV